MRSAHQWKIELEKSYVTCCELRLRLPLQFSFVVVWLFAILKQFYSDQKVLKRCQPNSECVSPTRNTVRTFIREEMSLNHWWVGFWTGEENSHTPWKTKLVRNMKLNLVCLNIVLSVYFQRPQEEKYPVGPILLGLFIFVVCGSGKEDEM